jgi:hypothetical protein
MSSGLDVEGRLEKMNIEEEYERRLRALSICLEEKAEENIRLAMSLEQKEDQFKKMNQQLENERNEKQEKGELAEEYQRRIQVLSTCLEDLAEENVKLLQKVKTTADSTDTYAVGLLPPVSQNSIANLSLSPNSPGGGSGNGDAEKLMQHLKAEKEERRKAEALIATLQEDLEKRKMAGRNFEKQVRMLSTKLQKEEGLFLPTPSSLLFLILSFLPSSSSLLFIFKLNFSSPSFFSLSLAKLLSRVLLPSFTPLRPLFIFLKAFFLLQL